MTTPLDLQKLYVGYFARAGDPEGFGFWLDSVNSAGQTLAQVADFFANSPEAKATYPYLANPLLVPVEDFLAQVYQNLFARPIDQAGLDFYANEIDTGAISVGDAIAAIINGASPGDAAILENKAEAALDWTQSVASAGIPFNDADGDALPDVIASAQGVVAGVDGTQESLDAALAGTDAFVATGGAVANTFTLTQGADQIPGLIGTDGTTNNDGDNLILAGTSVTGGIASNNLGSGDVLDGGKGDDILRISSTSADVMTAQMSNIERIDLQGIGVDPVLNLINATGVQQIWNYRTTPGEGIGVGDIQEEAIMGFFDTDADSNYKFATDVDFGGDIAVALDGAGVLTDFSEIEISGGNIADVTTLNVLVNVLDMLSPGESDSFVVVDLPGATDLETLTVANAEDGDVGVTLREDGAEFETLTSVDSTGLTGAFDIDLSDNDKDVTFTGGDGDTTVSFGDGDNDVTTGAGDDTITVDGSGDNTVDAGAGNDFVDFGGQASKTDSASGGEGDEDTIAIDVDVLETLTADDDFEGSIDGFERVYADNVVGDTEAFTIDLDNLDDIDYVITDGTQAGTAVAEQQRYDFDTTQQFGGRVTIEGVVIDVPAGLNDGEVAQFILDNFADQIKTAYEANNGATIDTITRVNFDQLQFDFARADGDVPEVDIVEFTGPVSAGAGFSGVNVVQNGTDGEKGVATFEVQDTTPWETTDLTVNFRRILDPDGTNDLPVTIDGGSSIDDTVVQIANAINARADRSYDATFDLGTNIVTVTAQEVGDFPLPADDIGTEILTTFVNFGVDPVAEVQERVITGGADADGGFIRISLGGSGFFDVKVDPNATVDEIGQAILAAQADILAAIPELAGIGYNTATDTLTFTGTLEAGDIGTVSVDNSLGNFPDLYNQAQVVPPTTIPGVDGGLGGDLTIDYTAPGGTLNLDGDNDGTTTVNVDGATIGGSDDFNIVLGAGHGDSDGDLNLAEIEVLNVENTTEGVDDLALNAPDAETVVVTGEGGVSFITPFANVTSFDASALVETPETTNTALLSVNAETTTGDDATFIGGVGNDSLITAGGDDLLQGGAGDDFLSGGTGEDTLEGGEGDDILFGGLGADELTGGAGADRFQYFAGAESNSNNNDLITDFTVGEDTLDFAAFGWGASFNFVGDVSGYGNVLTSLSAGQEVAAFDTSTNTLYVDADASGTLDDADFAIDMTLVGGALSDTDFFV